MFAYDQHLSRYFFVLEIKFSKFNAFIMLLRKANNLMKKINFYNKINLFYAYILKISRSKYQSWEKIFLWEKSETRNTLFYHRKII